MDCPLELDRTPDKMEELVREKLEPAAAGMGGGGKNKRIL